MEDHATPLEGGDEVSTVFIRQDPFIDSVYISNYNVMFALGQVVGVYAILYLIGFTLTYPWTSRLFNASLIKLLYKVKHTSAGRNLDQVPEHIVSNQKGGVSAVDDKNARKRKQKMPDNRIQPQNEIAVTSLSTKISMLWEKLDGVRWKRLKANI